MRKLQLLALIVFFAAFSCMTTKKPAGIGPHEDYGARAEIVIKDISYARSIEGGRKLKLDVYSNPHEGLWPAVVMIHGGAWIIGDKSMDNTVYVCQVLANNGYVVFDINYRLAPEYTIKFQIEDALGALKWVKAHAREYGADPSRVALVGSSAGGHISAVVAWNGSDPFFQPTDHPEDWIDTSVKAAALYFPPIDLEKTFKDNGNGFARLAHGAFAGTVGKPYQEQLKHISPVYYMRADIPPTLFLTGDKDELHLYPQSVDSVDKLKQLGATVEFFVATGKKHGFTKQYWDQITIDSTQAVVKFFDKFVK